MPKTRRNIAREAIYQQNASALVNQLTPEIVAHILRHGQPRALLRPKEKQDWFVNIDHVKYNLTVGAVCKGWRGVVLDTAALWTCIVFRCPSLVSHYPFTLKLFDFCIQNSKNAKIDLAIHFSARRTPSDKVISTVMSRLSALLPRAQKVFIHCGQIPITLIFPLSGGSMIMEELGVRMDDETEKADAPKRLTLIDAEVDIKSIHALSLQTWLGRINFDVSLRGIDPASIHYLNIEAKMIDLTEFQHFLRGCINLQSLTCACTWNWHLFSKDMSPPIVLPRLIHLRVHGQLPFHLLSLESPKLQHLVLNDPRYFPPHPDPYDAWSTPPLPSWEYQIFPSLRTLSLIGCGLRTCLTTTGAVQQFLQSHQGLVALTINGGDHRIPQLLLPNFDKHEGTPPQLCPRLTLLRINSAANQVLEDEKSTIDSVDLLMRKRPNLNVEWEYYIDLDERVRFAAENPDRVRLAKETGWTSPLPDFHTMVWEEEDDVVD